MASIPFVENHKGMRSILSYIQFIKDMGRKYPILLGTITQSTGHIDCKFIMGLYSKLIRTHFIRTTRR